MVLKPGAKRSIGLCVAIAALAIVAWVDIQPVLSAEAMLDTRLTPAVQAAMNDRFEGDIIRLQLCAKYQRSSLEYRDCLIEALERTETDRGAMVTVGSSEEWLELHPDDKEMKSAAMHAIDTGWTDLTRQQGILATAQLVKRERQRSVLARLSGAATSRSSNLAFTRAILWDLDWRMEHLQEVEEMVQAPALYRRQIRRRINLALAGMTDQ